MKSSQPERGNKAQIWNTAEGDKHGAQGESLVFFLSLPLYCTYRMQNVTMEQVVEEISFSPRSNYNFPH